MERVVFVEVLNWRGGVRERVRVDRFPVTIGRSYGNDVIVDDRFICPEHFRVYYEDDGSLVAEDAGSVNGIYAMKGQDRLRKISLGPDTQVRAGHTVFRFRQPDYKAPQAEAERSGWRAAFRPFENVYLALFIVLVCAGVMLLDTFLSKSNAYELSDLMDDLAALGLMFFLWSGIWSVLNRIVSHSFRFLQHLTLISAVMIGATLYENLFGYLSFVLILPPYAEIAKEAGYAFFFALALFGHMSIITMARPLRRLAVSVAASICIFGAVSVSDYLESRDFSNRLEFSSVLKPMDRKWLTSMSAEEFFGSLDELKDDVDAIDAELDEGDEVRDDADTRGTEDAASDKQ